jgi:5-methylcytosine-specific restriction protein A
MPVYACKWPTCSDFVPRKGDYCQAHAEEGRETKRNRNRFYDKHLRDRDAKKFYDSAAWKHARAKKLATDPICEHCREQFAEHVHHKKPLQQCTRRESLDQAMLMSACIPCHNVEEAELQRCSSR